MTALAPLLAARYGGAAAEWPAAENDTLALLLNHRSVRAFRPEPLEPGVLELLIAAAQSASSSSNLQAWSVVAVEDPTRKARLAQLAGNQAHILAAPLLLVWIADLSRLRRIASALGETSAGLDTLESFVVATVDATLAAQNAAVAAQSLGLGTVYIGALRNQPEAVAAELALPSGAFPLFGLLVGQPDPVALTAVKPRLPQDVVLHRECYRTADEAPRLVAYDRALQEFQQHQRLPVQPWTRQAVARIGTPAALGPRARLAEIVIRLGFTVA